VPLPAVHATVTLPRWCRGAFYLTALPCRRSAPGSLAHLRFLRLYLDVTLFCYRIWTFTRFCLPSTPRCPLPYLLHGSHALFLVGGYYGLRIRIDVSTYHHTGGHPPHGLIHRAHRTLQQALLPTALLVPLLDCGRLFISFTRFCYAALRSFRYYEHRGFPPGPLGHCLPNVVLTHVYHAGYRTAPRFTPCLPPFCAFARFILRYTRHCDYPLPLLQYPACLRTRTPCNVTVTFGYRYGFGFGCSQVHTATVYTLPAVLPAANAATHTCRNSRGFVRPYRIYLRCGAAVYAAGVLVTLHATLPACHCMTAWVVVTYHL